MPAKRKDKENHNTPAKSKRVKPDKNADFSDDENLSDFDDDGEIFNGIRIPSVLPPIVSAEENIGPRMIIDTIVVNNFKSYYGVVTIGPFHKVYFMCSVTFLSTLFYEFELYYTILYYLCKFKI